MQWASSPGASSCFFHLGHKEGLRCIHPLQHVSPYHPGAGSGHRPYQCFLNPDVRPYITPLLKCRCEHSHASCKKHTSDYQLQSPEIELSCQFSSRARRGGAGAGREAMLDDPRERFRQDQKPKPATDARILRSTCRLPTLFLALDFWIPKDLLHVPEDFATKGQNDWSKCLHHKECVSQVFFFFSLFQSPSRFFSGTSDLERNGSEKPWENLQR